MKRSKTYVIAEIGINHNGSIKIAKKLIVDAKISGADAAKFQIFEPETLGRPKMQKNKDQKKNSKKNVTLDKMWKKVYLNEKKIKVLKKFCKKNNLDFICSVFDKKSLTKVLSIGVDYIKIASSDINDIFLLKEVKSSGKKVILSTGMANLKEINRAKKILGKKVDILHCVSMYPCPIKYANLYRITQLRKELGVNIGYSDHTKGNNACKIAIMLGAKVIEKHFTYNKKLIGADHNISADKGDLKEIVQFARNYEEYLGNGKIKPSPLEEKNKNFFRKGLYFSKDIKNKKKININDLAFLRPSNAMDVSNYKSILGKKLKKNVYKFQKIKNKLFF
tara:strand:- start:757 stop:1761 length:1005 start_codon:yes stop_codon:yes gene_type:complete